jgi:DNA-binding NtrC family response regulator
VWVKEATTRRTARVRAALARRGVDVDAAAIMLLEHEAELMELEQRAAAGEQMIVLLTESSPQLDPWSVLASGATDVIAWEDDGTAEAVLARLAVWRDVDEILDGEVVRGAIQGHSRALRLALRQLVQAAQGSSAPILLSGETGTGKELAARLVHAVGGNREAPYVVLDCTTIVPTLSGSELFGHERGSFTGAVASRTGAVAAANGGTLFLDEVGELPVDLQAGLLRVIQEGTYKRMGGDTWLRAQFRLVAATNRDLAAEQAAGRFRRDLYYRLAASTVQLPPLRERPEDILPLFCHFLDAGGVPGPVSLTPPVAEWLRARDYPGNVRDLRQLAERVAIRHRWTGPVTVGDIPPEDRPPGSFSVPAQAADGPDELERAVRGAVRSRVGLKELKEEVAELAVAAALEWEHGSVGAAARRLGVTERALQLRRAKAEASRRAGPGE